MAMLTTVDQLQYYFDPKGIVALSDHDPSTGKAVTCVYGISTAYLHIGESVQQLMTRLQIAANFGQVTRADGSPMWINNSAVTSIRSRVSTDPAGVNSGPGRRTYNAIDQGNAGRCSFDIAGARVKSWTRRLAKVNPSCVAASLGVSAGPAKMTTCSPTAPADCALTIRYPASRDGMH